MDGQSHPVCIPRSEQAVTELAGLVLERFTGVVDRFNFYAPYRMEPERWAEVAGACQDTLRELRRVTCAIETLQEALLRKSRGDRPTLPGREIHH